MGFICCEAAGLSPVAVRCGVATGGGVMMQAWRACSPKPAAETQRHEHGVRTNWLGCFLGFCILTTFERSSLFLPRANSYAHFDALGES